MLTVSSNNLQQLVANALERMAFVSVHSSDTTPGEVLAQAVAHASIQLRGPTVHIVTVSATGGMVQEIASGMIGCAANDIDVDDHGMATVTELANVLAGELVMHQSDQDEGLMIGLPQELGDEDAGLLADRAVLAGSWSISGSQTGLLMVSVIED